MKIVVCIKQVPDTEAEVKWDLQKGTLKREAMDSVTNPFDEFALEEALLTKEKYDAEIVAITMGPEKATDVLRNALALGVDSVYHVTDPAFAGSDTLATSYALAKAVEKVGGADVVFCGKQATDGNTGIVASELAARLGFSQLSFVGKVVEIDAANKRIKVERGIEGGNEVVEAKLPAVVSVLKGINEPRLPNLMGIRKATKIPIPAWDADAIGAAKDKIGVEGSAIKVIELTTPPPRSGGEVLKGELAEVSNLLVEKLLDLKVIK
ncbi:MAG: electron transfer flavoprotein subunit beta/FixA family protein [Syntrophorhabdales bacterium]